MTKFTLEPLPYVYENLEPVISRQIMELHHDKHHAAYVDGANAASEKLAAIRKGESGNIREVMRDLSFNLNGVLMHEMFWQNMRKPIENNKAGGTLLPKIEEEFGSYEGFINEFSSAAVAVEGAGWAVLWKTAMGSLVIGQLEKHNLLGYNGATPILVLDVWEHAYYPQYLNNRKSYVEAWWQVVNWEDVGKRWNQK